VPGSDVFLSYSHNDRAAARKGATEERLQRRRALPAQDQQRMLWVIWGCAIGLSAFIFAEIAQSTSLLQHRLGVSPSPALIGLLYLLNGVLAYFVSVAVLHRRVMSVAIPLRYGTPHQDAADIFQAVCLDLFNELPRLRDAEALQGWLTRVTANPAQDQAVSGAVEDGVYLPQWALTAHNICWG
jgi:hypothetical protein